MVHLGVALVGESRGRNAPDLGQRRSVDRLGEQIHTRRGGSHCRHRGRRVAAAPLDVSRRAVGQSCVSDLDAGGVCSSLSLRLRWCPGRIRTCVLPPEGGAPIGLSSALNRANASVRGPVNRGLGRVLGTEPRLRLSNREEREEALGQNDARMPNSTGLACIVRVTLLSDAPVTATVRCHAYGDLVALRSTLDETHPTMLTCRSRGGVSDLR